VKISIISGRSGAGKTICLHVLEDLGYYCIDNLPVHLLPHLIEHIIQNAEKIAIGLDARNLPTDLNQLSQLIQTVKSNGHQCQLIYLNADDSVLIKRFSETRRKHPLSNEHTSLQEALHIESSLLEPVADLADLQLDTSQLTTHQLRHIITQRVSAHRPELSLLLQSFGYKFGIPADSDFVFDVRFLSNPYWEPELRVLTGLDPKVHAFMDSKPETQEFIQQLSNFLSTWMPHFIASNRSYMTISIGCTGGQHRSVFIVDALEKRLIHDEVIVQVRHRELE
jgi:RNase adapter protein RapZ